MKSYYNTNKESGETLKKSEGNTMSDLFFKINVDCYGDMYTHLANKWYRAGGDFMDKPTEAKVIDYFKAINPNIKVEFKTYEYYIK